jgi:glycosyltransferase involved in cell wall biosynthesis
MPLVISLHGHWFAEWPRTNCKTRIFLKILSTAKLVVVYNSCQKRHLIEHGLKEEGIRMIANTCDIKPLSNDQVTTKHLSASVIRILFLSNLIDSKGYKEFLGMLRLIDNFNCPMHIEAVLCGKIMQAGFSKGSAETIENIESLISEINNNTSIRAIWIKGASDTEKQELFKKTHIFVFPSRIEAQPIVLIEAMASGCAIISSKAGLIPSMLGDNAAVLLENLSHEEIAKQTVNLINNQHKRNSLALAALERCRNLFSISVYEKSWNNLFIELTT